MAGGAADSKLQKGRSLGLELVVDARQGVETQGFGTCVLILGPSYANGSALGRGFADLGCAVADSAAISSFNDDLLASAGSARNDVAPFHEPWLQSPLAPAYLERAAALLEQQFGQVPLFAIEDPAIGRIVPFWTEALTRFGCAMKIALTVNNPLDVPSDQISEVPTPLAPLLWLRHALDAERATRGMQRFISSNEQVTYDWATVADDAQRSLEIIWPRASTAVDEKAVWFAGSTADAQRELTQRALTSAQLPNWVRETYKIMNQWAQHGECAEDYLALDNIRAEFDVAAIAFSKALRARGTRMMAGLRTTVPSAGQDPENVKVQLQEQRRRNTLLEAELHQLREEREDIQAQLKEASAEVKVSRDRRKEMARIIERRNAELQARYRDLAILQRRLLRFDPTWRTKRLWGWIKRLIRLRRAGKSAPPVEG